MTAELPKVPLADALSMLGSCASMEATFVTRTPAWREECRPRLILTVWYEGAVTPG
jgi:hypothetical protein